MTILWNSIVYQFELLIGVCPKKFVLLHWIFFSNVSRRIKILKNTLSANSLTTFFLPLHFEHRFIGIWWLNEQNSRNERLLKIVHLSSPFWRASIQHFCRWWTLQQRRGGRHHWDGEHFDHPIFVVAHYNKKNTMK